jgi:hypothetical protein
VLNDKELERGIVRVIDLAFLHGYYEQTLAILYETMPTFLGDECEG